MKETVLYQAPASVGNASITVFGKDGVIRTYPLADNISIGRNSEGSDADIRLDSSIASRDHGMIFRIKDTYYYRDNGSRNGTFLNGERLGSCFGEKDTSKLEDGDILRIDRSDLKKHHPEAVLLLFRLGEGEHNWTRKNITELSGDIEIGREASGSGSLRVDDEAVSRHHATFRRGVNGWFVVDHNSTNGVYVNQNRIEGAVSLYPLDVIRIAGTLFVYSGDSFCYDAESADNNALSINIKERSVKNRFKKKVLLQDIQLTVNPGEMVLILGGSGAGKTTFLNAVMGYEKADAVIRHGDTDIYKNYSKMKHQIAYVPQQDLIRGEDTVIATLANAASMKLPNRMSANEKNERIRLILDMLGLSREERSLVNKLSGGQKKRLSIAIELISDPTLFFLDEPDSGLDGIMAYSLMETLRAIADEGKVVMVITHAPDRVAALFDKVIVLAKSVKTNSGRLAYYGPVDEAMQFFSAESLEGIVKKINREDEGGEGLSDFYIEKYAEYREGKTDE